MSKIKTATLRMHSLIDNLDNSDLSQNPPEVNDGIFNASFRCKDGETTISYEEDTEGGKVFCDMLQKDGRFTVERRGAVKSVLIFDEGKSYSGIYEIPPYKFDISVFTKRLKLNFHETGGTADILYTMTVGGAQKRCRMKISVEA